jgi:hypothetical protein
MASVAEPSTLLPEKPILPNKLEASTESSNVNIRIYIPLILGSPPPFPAPHPYQAPVLEQYTKRLPLYKSEFMG